MFRYALSLVVLLSLACIAAAQTRIDGGLAFGVQPYEATGENPRYQASFDVIVRARTFGAQIAIDYTDLPDIGSLYATHVDAIYRRGERNYLLAGAGPTFLSKSSGDVTWNAQLEVGHVWRGKDLFIRARHYDFRYLRSHDLPASPSGPAIYAGIRFPLHR